MRNHLLEIERTVVSSLMCCELYDIEYKDVDEDIFTLDVHKWIIRHIKKARDKNYPIDLMMMKLEALLVEKLKGWQDEYAQTMSQTPIASWYKYFQ